ncbi:MAG: hypothetical protein JNM79_02680 [Burkholderiales bacterium]|nr:hypothetical protein [Burkholderiales bacterium]
MIATAIVEWVKDCLRRPVSWISEHPADLALALIGLAVAMLLLRWLVGWFPRGVALRPVRAPVRVGNEPDPPAGMPNHQRWYIESQKRPEFFGDCYSCSFVEFDERGDYLDFHQHKHAYQKVLGLAKASTRSKPLVLVIYVHGWRNNSQSRDVVSFNRFLSQLAAAKALSEAGSRVHGIYLGWRAANFGNTLADSDPHLVETTDHFGQAIVDPERRAPFRSLAAFLETLGYWDRKAVPERKVAGTSFSRTVFTCAHIAKRFAHNRVLLIGHSFGGLMLERTVQNAVVGELIGAWPSSNHAPHGANPLPFDLLLSVNSAAPSIYARQFQSLMAAHYRAMQGSNPPSTEVPGTGQPVFVSITSEADWATRVAHRVANSLAWVNPALRRKYRADDYILDVQWGTEQPMIPQYEYYGYTPGHNPLLVNRFIEAAGADIEATEAEELPAFNASLALRVSRGAPLVFETVSRAKSGVRRSYWRVGMPPDKPALKDWGRYKGTRPIAWNPDEHESAYWIVRCPKALIGDHNDIWNESAMQMYAAFIH